MMTTSLRPVLGAALMLVVSAGAARVAPPAAAQDLPGPGDGFTWERVGDRQIQPYGLAFGRDSTLWATGTDGPHRLDLSGGFPGAWVLQSEYPFIGSLIVLGKNAAGRDTLVSGRGSTKRSVDGGLTWATVHDRGGAGLYEIPAGLPHAGRILTGATEYMAYSDDRAATFTNAVRPAPDDNRAGAEAFVALPPGSPNAGRILAPGRWGVNISDDGGATFRESGLWQAAYYYGLGVAFAGRPVVGGGVNAQADARMWTSDDDGETWGPGDGYHLPEDGVEAVMALGGASVLTVLHYGYVYRTDDAGETWALVGQVPDIVTGFSVTSAVLGPDGRLYVGVIESGSSGEGWVWRTNEVLTVPTAAEPVPVPEDALLDIAVEPNPARRAARVVLTLARPAVISASVYDALGRRVAVLHAGALGAGEHAFSFDGAALPAGAYVVRAEAEGAVVSQPFTLVR